MFSGNEMTNWLSPKHNTRGKVLPTQRRSLRQIYALTIIIMLYLIYPTLIQQCAAMFTCQSFQYRDDVSNPDIHSFMEVYRSF